MTFEEILPGLKAKKSTFVQAGAERRTTSSSLTPLRSTGKAGGDALLPHQRDGRGRRLLHVEPTPCDVLATDWVEVHD